MRQGQGQRDSCKSACSKIYVMKEKGPSGRECNDCANEILGYRGCQNHGHTLQEGQGSVLTNQCLGKKTNAGRGTEESFLTDSDKFIVLGSQNHMS